MNQYVRNKEQRTLSHQNHCVTVAPTQRVSVQYSFGTTSHNVPRRDCKKINLRLYNYLTYSQREILGILPSQAFQFLRLPLEKNLNLLILKVIEDISRI